MYGFCDFPAIGLEPIPGVFSSSDGLENGFAGFQIMSQNQRVSVLSGDMD